MSDETPPPSPETAKKAPKEPEKKEAPATKDAVKAAGEKNEGLEKKYGGLKVEADAKKPPGYDPAQFPSPDKVKADMPKLNPRLFLDPSRGFNFLQGEMANGPRTDALRTGRGALPASSSLDSSSRVDPPYRDVVGGLMDRAVNTKTVFVSPKIPIPGS